MFGGIEASHSMLLREGWRCPGTGAVESLTEPGRGGLPGLTGELELSPVLAASRQLGGLAFVFLSLHCLHCAGYVLVGGLIGIINYIDIVEYKRSATYSRGS